MIFPTPGLDSARPAASAGLVGQIYYSTDAGVAYQCVSATVWKRVGSIGVEGLDTTSVIMGGTVGARATGNATVAAATVISGAVTFGEVSAPTGVAIIMLAGPHQLEIGNNSGNRHEISLFENGVGTARVSLGSIAASPTTRHTIAWKTVGFTTTWSLDGSAAATASHTSGSPSGTTALSLGSGSFPSAVYLSEVVLWATALSSAELAAASAGYAAGRIPEVSGATETIRWHARNYPAGVLTQQLQRGTAAGTLITWVGGFPLTSRAS